MISVRVRVRAGVRVRVRVKVRVSGCYNVDMNCPSLMESNGPSWLPTSADPCHHFCRSMTHRVYVLVS